jgi:hypothetical protein
MIAGRAGHSSVMSSIADTRVAPALDPRRGAAEKWIAAAVFAAMFLAYNANGREIGSYDSRPTALAARELLVHGTLRLDEPVAGTPAYATRWGFIRDRAGHYRSIYSPVPALIAAALAWPAWKLGVIDVQAPLGPSLVAKLTASACVALAVMMAYLTVRRTLSRRMALVVAAGLGLGTGYWSSASQTLWQTETALLGLSVAVLLLTAEAADEGAASSAAFGAALALALTARPQLAPAIAVMLIALAWRSAKAAAIAVAVVAAGAVALAAANVRWFGQPLGALPLLIDANAAIHATAQTFAVRKEGYIGLLLSPSRGILIFSPIVLSPLSGVAAAVRRGPRLPANWCALAAVTQFVLYGSYSVWWGGHTFGPRYMLDVLPLLVPLAALALRERHSAPWKAVAGAALAWSVLVAATGAFCYPNDAWNTSPTDVDRDHARLWSISDNQIRRCWTAGASPQNFRLMSRAAFRQTER